ncbi:MAG TPA: hypothetical protein PKA38_04125 [Candidatus Levybacteria bacterium]|nr:hypothetical protein [Candidatus Levybacteria bacterium]
MVKIEEEIFEGEIFSEESELSALDSQILAGEWENLTKNEFYHKRTRGGRIIAMHQAISNRIKQLEKLFYPLVRDYPEKAEKLLAEIKRLRLLQQYLLQAYVWEEQGEFDEHSIPSEVKDLI